MASSSFSYVVKTNLDPEHVNQLGLEIFAKWVEFALGQQSLGGRKLIYPTGRYAASISFQKTGEASVAIIADEKIAPEALFLETGHAQVDLKTKLQQGRAYPMHRPPGNWATITSTGLRRVGAGPAKPSMWAEVRAAGSSGYASIGPNSPADSWIIPSMPAYAPAAALAALARSKAAGR